MNGSTIIRDNVEQVDYVHVELDTHAVILAEGAPSESFMEPHYTRTLAIRAGSAAQSDRWLRVGSDPAAAGGGSSENGGGGVAGQFRRGKYQDGKSA